VERQPNRETHKHEDRSTGPTGGEVANGTNAKNCTDLCRSGRKVVHLLY